tara:strand:- start:830 stop:1198 length:369 start_codon:yes stop_codon:yes gene_type:complete
MTLTLRNTKGSALTYAEMDANFSHVDLFKSVENVTGGGALSTNTVVSFISTTGVESYTLADGVEGQEKIIIMKADGGNATVTPNNLVGFTSVRLTATNNSFHLIYGSTGWNIIALQQATRIS